MTRRARTSKLSLHRETLRALEASITDLAGNRSCLESCYDMSCEGGCGISEGATTA